MSKTVLVSPALPDIIRKTMLKLNCRLINVPCNPSVAEPVRAHPDMSLCCIGQKVVTAPHIESDSIISKAVTASGRDFIAAKTPQSNIYPHDCAYNILFVLNSIYCNTTAAAPEVLDAAKEQGLNVIHVPQGYAACSTLKINDRAVITADRKIFAAVQKNGVDALLIGAGHIVLDGYTYGFIGGASAAVGTDVIFFGNLAAHPECEKISDFIESHGCRAISAGCTPLYDYGGAVVLN